MSIVQFSGPGPLFPMPPAAGLPLAMGSVGDLANTSDKIAFIGPVWFQGATGSKAIRKISFLLGSTLVKAGASAARISLQDVSLAAGPVIRPDGTADQSYAVANTNTESGWSANSWFTTGNLSADRTVNYGDLVAVVFEFTTRNGSDAFGLQALLTGAGPTLDEYSVQQNCTISVQGGGVWVTMPGIPNVLFEFSDGTFGTLGDTFPISTLTAGTIDINTASDERALVFRFPMSVEVDGLWALLEIQPGADFELILYSGTTALQTVSIDADAMLADSTERYIFVPIPKTTLAANTDYRVAVKPTTVLNVTLPIFIMNSGAHRAAYPFGTDAAASSRADGGSWSDSSASRPCMGVRLSGIDPAPVTNSGSFCF